MSASGGSVGNNEFFGLDLLLRTVQNDVSKKSDVIIILVHWLLTKNSNFRCIGLGDDRTVTADDIGSELLPDQWNDTGEKYTLRYTFNGELYLLVATQTADVLLLNLLNTKNNKVSNLAIRPESVVAELKGNIQTMVPTASSFVHKVNKELIEPVFSGTSKDGATQTHNLRQQSDQSLYENYRNPLQISAPHNPLLMPQMFPDPLRDVGRGDLLPGGGFGGGGMLFDPPRPNPFGPGRPTPNPSGIRFDPFAPPGVRQNPDNDHFRPPRGNDWDDNMYM